MKLIDFIRLVRKHLVLLTVSPLLLAGIVIMLSLNPDFKYASDTTLYTGIATGTSVEMDKSFNYFTTNTAFDNLINIIKSRKTQQEVAIRLLSLHLMLDKPDSKYISAKSYNSLKQITPEYVYSYVATDFKDKPSTTELYSDDTKGRNTINMQNREQQDVDFVNLPDYINRDAYEQTVKNLTHLMESNDTNFVYDLLSYPNPHYSYKDISEIKVQRIANSDLVQLKYVTDDPGICQQTLAIMTYVCIRNYRDIKENRSDAVVKYFEQQLQQASVKLRMAEDKLLQFNKDNKIINYYEQSKAVAVVKEDLDVAYNNQKMKLAGFQAAIQRLEEKMGLQEQIQLKSAKIMDLKNQLSELNYKIASSEIPGNGNTMETPDAKRIKQDAEILKIKIKEAVGELYSYKNSKDGLPLNTILNDWISNVIEAENVKAGMDVLEERIQEFQQQYSIYAPAGANIKRIEREISVSEQEFLEILHGLNLAKLKIQDNELSSNIKIVDQPYYPISPIPTKRKIMVILAAMLGFLIVLSFVIASEYFDQSLRNLPHASKILKMNHLGLIPRISKQDPKVPVSILSNRLAEIIIQNMDIQFRTRNLDKPVKTVLFFSTQAEEGKSIIAGNLAIQLKNMGKTILFLNYSTHHDDPAVGDSKNIMHPSSDAEPVNTPSKLTFLSKLFGYSDNQIDFENRFLKAPEKYLEKYEYLKYRFGHECLNLNSLFEYVRLQTKREIPEYIFIEIPAILHYAYPTELISEIELPILVCRANRVWTEADRSMLDNLLNMNDNTCSYILNGVELQVVESILGELPKKRSWLRRAVKRLVLFQFLSKNHL